jgi:hypothetical protein
LPAVCGVPAKLLHKRVVTMLHRFAAVPHDAADCTCDYTLSLTVAATVWHADSSACGPSVVKTVVLTRKTARAPRVA